MKKESLSKEKKTCTICLFTDTYDEESVNGVARFVRDMETQAKLQKKHIYVFTCGQKQKTTKYHRNYDAGIRMKLPKYPQIELCSPVNPLEVVRDVRALKPDIVHISTPGPMGHLGFFVGWKLKLPIVGVYHTDFPAFAKAILLKNQMFQPVASVAKSAVTQYLKTFYHPFCMVISRSKDYEHVLVKELNVPKKKIRTLPPGVDTHAFSPRLASASFWEKEFSEVSKDSMKLLYVGRITREKNIGLLVDICKELEKLLKPSDPKIELLLVGKGNWSSYQKRAEACKHVKIHYVGPQFEDMLSKMYANADMFVFPSVTDTLGQVVMEAAASGLPVLVTTKGGPKTIIDSSFGKALPENSPKKWAKEIVELARDPKKQKEMKRQARLAMEKRDMKASFEAFWSVHRDICREFTPRAPLPKRIVQKILPFVS